MKRADAVRERQRYGRFRCCRRLLSSQYGCSASKTGPALIQQNRRHRTKQAAENHDRHRALDLAIPNRPYRSRAAELRGRLQSRSLGQG